MNTIKSNLEISEIFSKGDRYNTPSVMFIVLKKNDRANKSSGRVAFIASKKSGNAVWRNSAKRRLREICRQTIKVPNAYDVVLIAKKNILKRDFWKIVKECDKIKYQFK